MEKVNHPSHYKSNGDFETIKKMEILFGKKAVITFCRLTAFKYLDRAGFKDDKNQDLAKMDWYLRYAEELENEW